MMNSGERAPAAGPRPGGPVPTGNRVPAGGPAPAHDADTSAQPTFRRVLLPVADADQAGHAAELARRAGAGEARVLHLNLRETIRGQRFALEAEASASRAVEVALLELRVAGIAASGLVCHALIDKAAEAIVAEAEEWGADLIVLGAPRRNEFVTRLFGSVTLRVLQHAPCPVLVASPAREDRPCPRGTSAHHEDHFYA